MFIGSRTYVHRLTNICSFLAPVNILIYNDVQNCKNDCFFITFLAVFGRNGKGVFSFYYPIYNIGIHIIYYGDDIYYYVDDMYE